MLPLERLILESSSPVSPIANNSFFKPTDSVSVHDTVAKLKKGNPNYAARVFQEDC